MGGLGGFFPPLILSFLFNMTGNYSIGFMALSQVALACLIIVVWMYHQEKLELSQNIVDHTIEGVMVTDLQGTITRVNPAFTMVTGYTMGEVIGKTPKIIQSGKHDKKFYEKMWVSIKTNGYWKGEIWNKRKNGEIYLEWLTISPVQNTAGETKYYVGMFTEIKHHKA